MEINKLASALEAVLFVTGEPVSQKEICNCFGVSYSMLEDAAEILKNKYNKDSGILFLAYGDSMQLSSNPDHRQYIENMLNPIQRKSLSQASLEVLSIIAYKQPVTRGEIEEIRGVKCDYSVMWLLQKGLIQEAGRKDTVGHPMLFVTTDLFLRHFGLSGLDELPERADELTMVEDIEQ